MRSALRRSRTDVLLLPVRRQNRGVPRGSGRGGDGRMRTSETTSAVFDAIVKTQAVLSAVTKDKTAKIPTKSGGSFSYSYASLDSVIDHVHGALMEQGLAVVQEAGNCEDDLH